MYYVNIILRCLVALVPALGSILERHLGEKAKQLFRISQGYLFAVYEVTDEWKRVRSAESEGGEEVTKAELDSMMFRLSCLLNKAKEDGLL